jgi:hypothetical protein
VKEQGQREEGRREGQSRNGKRDKIAEQQRGVGG